MSKLTQEQRETLASELLSDDLISRQDAIDAIEHYLKHTPKNYSELFVQGMDDAYYRTLSILRTLPSAQPKQRWLPCSERFPELDVPIVFTTAIGALDVGFRIDADTMNQFYSETCKCRRDNDDVIAWQPLPEPYKAEE